MTIGVTRHYRSEDGICGYKVGDILVNDTTGEAVEVIKDGRGFCLKPAGCMAVATNSEGRPCGWAVAPTEAKAREVAERMWEGHGAVRHGEHYHCYPGEARGPVKITWVKRHEHDDTERDHDPDEDRTP